MGNKKPLYYIHWYDEESAFFYIFYNGQIFDRSDDFQLMLLKREVCDNILYLIESMQDMGLTAECILDVLEVIDFYD